MKMRILFGIHPNTEHYDGPIAYGIVDMDEELARNIAGKLKMFRESELRDPTLESLAFRDIDTIWISASVPVPGRELPEDIIELLPPDIKDHYENHMWCYLPDDIEIPETNHQRTEYNRLVITDGLFWWECSPKHYDGMTVETHCVEHGFLSQFI